MNRSPNQPPETGSDEDRVLAAVANGGKQARFVTEIARDLAKAGGGLAGSEIEQALAALEDQGRLLIREHYCADPHLEGVDLRIAGAVVQGAEGGDPISACVHEIEATWQDWITAYLAEHRCS
jgi:hypothetical protein